MMGVEKSSRVTDLRELRRTVEHDVESYRYEISPDKVGRPLTKEKIEGELTTMRSAIVDPYWVEVELRDTVEQINADPKALRKCAVVADAGRGTLLAFDPVEEEFLLAVRSDNELVSIGVRGDAVGCFMAR